MLKFATTLLLAGALAVLALVLPAFAGDDAATPEPPHAELGKKAPAIVMKDTDGRSFELHDCAIAPSDAEAVVRAAAVMFGAAKDAPLTTAIASLSGVQEDGEVDMDKVRDLAVAAGAYFGLTATEESVEGMATLADLVTWVREATTAPILLMTWSPKCPTTRKLNDRILETVAKLKLRAFAVACNTRDTDEMYAEFRENIGFPLRVFPDRDQRVTDILGGKTTPHFFLFDSKGVLRYRGGLDNDPMGFMDDDERKDHVADAAAAVRAGKPVEVQETEPAG